MNSEKNIILIKNFHNFLTDRDSEFENHHKYYVFSKK